jgi:glycerol-3-phosphate O-acyltransferase/dihydroxyacetone phosphate acyltransferase
VAAGNEHASMTVTAITMNLPTANAPPTPAPEQRRRTGDRVMQRLARLLMGVFFRQIEVVNGSTLPTDRPAVVVANHVNGLVDGMVLMSALPRYPRFLGKSTLFKILPLAPLLHLAGVVPVYRASDGGTAGNDATFKTCRALLARRGLIGIFPEGISHDEASLQPLRTGAARIALESAADEAPDTVVVPVGLSYDEKSRFRSRAVVHVGDPISMTGWLDDYRSDPVATVHALTEAIDAGLRSAGPNFRSIGDAVAWNRIADIILRPLGGEVLDDIDLARRDAVAGRLAHQAADGNDDDLLALADGYDAALALAGLTDAEVASVGAPERERARVVRALTLTAVSAPVAATGAAIHAVPYVAIKQIAKRPTNEGMKATVKVLGCLASFIVVYTGLGIVVGRRRGALAGVAAAVAAPATGYVAMRFGERLHRIGGAVSTARRLRDRSAQLPDLIDLRREIVTRASV